MKIIKGIFGPRAKGLLCACLLLLCCPGATTAAPVIVTITGTVLGGDGYNIFKVGKSLDHQNFSLTFTFDDANAQKSKTDCSKISGMPGSFETIYSSGSNPASPGIAVLTIGKASYTWKEPGGKWDASVTLASPCTFNKIQIDVKEGNVNSAETIRGVNIRLQPPQGDPPFITALDWHSPLKVVKFDPDTGLGNYFMIYDSHKPGTSTQGYLFPKGLTIK